MENRDFYFWKKQFETDNLAEFSQDINGVMWLKLKSILRKELINSFIEHIKFDTKSTKLETIFTELFAKAIQDSTAFDKQLNEFIENINRAELSQFDTNHIVSELYQMKTFDWGGDYKNALDKYLVDKYVKKYDSFSELTQKFDTEINRAVSGYVLCSWYNHWSSIVIENLFKAHSKVLAAPGKIKKVDFFIQNIPFDLKVTYLPQNFIEKRRRVIGLKPEITELKQAAKALGIQFNKTARADDIAHEIIEKLKDRNTQESSEILKSIDDTRLKILTEVQANPKLLIYNLYEEQGELRFDAANRLFLVLVNTVSFENSWKLKRNLDLLRPVIHTYLDTCDFANLDNYRIDFTYNNKQQTYTAYSDVIFVVK